MGEKPESPSNPFPTCSLPTFQKTKPIMQGRLESGPPFSGDHLSHWINQSRSQFKAVSEKGQGPGTIIGCRKARAVSGPPKHTVGAHRLRSLRSLNSD